MNLFGIDPGTAHCGLVVYATMPEHRLVWSAVLPPDEALEVMRSGEQPRWCLRCVVEQAMGYGSGRAAGAALRDTATLVGRFLEAWDFRRGQPPSGLSSRSPAAEIVRSDVKHWMVGNPNAKDPEVSRAVRARFQATGGGAEPVVGIKARPGPLYGLTTHSVQALAAAIAHAERDLGLPRAPVLHDGRG